MPIYPDYSCYEKLPKEKRSFFKSEVKHFPAPIDVITLQGTSKLRCRARVNDGLGVLWYGCDALPYSQCEGEDEDADVVEEDDGHEGVHVVLHVTGGGELFGDEGFLAKAGMDKALKGVEVSDDAFKPIEAMINSMTPAERANPSLLNGSRKARIAKGAGVDIVALNRFLKQFEQTSKMMRKVQQMSGKRR